MDALGNTTNNLMSKTNAIIHVHFTEKISHLHVQLYNIKYLIMSCIMQMKYMYMYSHKFSNKFMHFP